MSTSSEEESSEHQSPITWVAAFVKDNPVILNKSQTPAFKARKDRVLEELRLKYEERFGQATTSKQLLKKINNLKTIVKKKADRKVTGNKKVKFSVAEKWIYDALQKDQGDNPTLSKIPGCTATGINIPATDEMVARSSTSATNSQPNSGLPPVPKPQKALLSLETDETRKLSNTELQRLVLLEQLHVLRMKKQQLEQGMQRIETCEGKEYNVL